MASSKTEDQFVPKVVVGIDLGTSNSGFAYASFSNPDDINCDQKVGGAGRCKQLTAVLLNEKMELLAFGNEAQTAYMQSTTDMQKKLLYFENFKMVLYGENLHERPVLTAANGTPVPCQPVFSAALSYFKKLALERINTGSTSSISIDDIQFVLTVPAIWSNAAKQIMREAAKVAGLYNKHKCQLLFALESDAASLACFHHEKVNNASKNLTGKYMVYDLGGGTADMTVHKPTNNNQNLSQVVCSSGGPWGSSYIDVEFIKLLGHLFGDDMMTSFKAECPADYIELLNDFRSAKHSFSSKTLLGSSVRLPFAFITHFAKHRPNESISDIVAKFSQNYHTTKTNINIPPGGISLNNNNNNNNNHKNEKEDVKDVKVDVKEGVVESTISSLFALFGFQSDQKPKKNEDVVMYVRGQLKLSAEMMMVLFKPILSKLILHLKEQLHQTELADVAYIFLVGGLAESPVIQQAIGVAVDEICQLKQRKIKVIIPHHAALAVLTGSVMSGLQPHMINERVCMYTYGVAVSCEWNAKKHSDRKKSFRPNNTRLIPFCDGIFSPFCRRGDKVKIGSVESQTYTPGEDLQKLMILKIYRSLKRDVQYIDDSESQLCSILHLDMPNVDGNLNRQVKVSMEFGASEIEVVAHDMTSKGELKIKMNYLDIDDDKINDNNDQA